MLKALRTAKAEVCWFIAHLGEHTNEGVPTPRSWSSTVIWMTNPQLGNNIGQLQGMGRNLPLQKRIQSLMLFTRMPYSSWNARSTSLMPSLPLPNPTIFRAKSTSMVSILWSNPTCLARTSSRELIRHLMANCSCVFVLHGMSHVSPHSLTLI